MKLIKTFMKETFGQISEEPISLASNKQDKFTRRTKIPYKKPHIIKELGSVIELSLEGNTFVQHQIPRKTLDEKQQKVFPQIAK